MALNINGSGGALAWQGMRHCKWAGLRPWLTPVTGALRLLKDRKLANYTPYGAVTLTDAGKKAAAEITRKHDVLNSFFADVLGLKKDIAQQTACRAEHALGEEVVRKLLSFIEFVAVESSNGSDMTLKFRKYCRMAIAKG